ncbi:formylglycine-generating enzyme family protein [Methylolobus aquaticus]|nr:formylglycine-generating enzyme family protein [Methylolobus aquaticus]
MAASLSLAANFPAPFPAAWASAWGEDEYGLWMTLEYGGAEQTFRWIEPGTFLMGSPEDEPERSDDEVQHEVTLTRGYWLADTACTQGLWVAVMDENPSQFKDNPENPVENVSWEEVQKFVRRLNEPVEGLNARLPTEAQWEYACRAGTGTPYWFGETISPEEANFARLRGGAMPVKRFPPNRWGLYQMHGNVWEWCADWYGLYPEGAVMDPTGPLKGTSRVLRGGSWIDLPRGVRSAYRPAEIPSQRIDKVGFRLALDSGHSRGQ